ncbi:hypothetical protein MD484_g3755, partial [Candolleomyces efflorescens]
MSAGRSLVADVIAGIRTSEQLVDRVLVLYRQQQNYIYTGISDGLTPSFFSSARTLYVDVER